MDFLKTIGGKIVGGLVALAVVAGAISWFEMDPQTRHAIVSGTGRILGWLALVLILPWATFFLIGAVSRTQSNLAGAALVFAYSAIEGVLLAWLFGWAVKGAMPVVFFGAAVLFAAAYNLLACDWIAEKIE
jgi:FtsH-binding integral membrane protein